MIEPDHDAVLASVIAAIENEIAPDAGEYAASVCRTAAQMLRHVRARLHDEVPSLVAGNAELRDLLRRTDVVGLPDHVAAAIDAAVGAEPVAVHPDLGDLRADTCRLRGALVAAIESVDEGHPLRAAARQHIAAQLRREFSWQQDAYTGPRR